MKEEIVTFQVAKLAKEKGFNLSVQTLYNDSGYKLNNGFYPDTHHEDIPAPTQSLLQRWLREVHNIHLAIECFNDEEPNYHATIYAKALWRDDEFGDATYTHFTSYEEALEVGLQEALKLIEL